jgi:hypothetical protein
VNNSDERDYAEEAVNRRLLDEGDDPAALRPCGFGRGSTAAATGIEPCDRLAEFAVLRDGVVRDAGDVRCEHCLPFLIGARAGELGDTVTVMRILDFAVAHPEDGSEPTISGGVS